MNDMETRVATLEIAMRQIMQETGVKHMPDGQPLYTGAYDHGLTARVERIVGNMDRRGWPQVVQVGIVLAFLLALAHLVIWAAK